MFRGATSASSARQKFDHISTIPGRNQGGREADAGFGAQPQLDRLVSRRRSRARSLVHDARGTGGSTFAPEYERLADQGRVLLAVADSDRRHDSSDFGETYRKLEAEASGRPAYQRSRALHMRMAEALVPLDVRGRRRLLARHRRDCPARSMHTGQRRAVQETGRVPVLRGRRARRPRAHGCAGMDAEQETEGRPGSPLRLGSEPRAVRPRRGSAGLGPRPPAPPHLISAPLTPKARR